MEKLLKAIFATAAILGLVVIMLAGSSIDYPGPHVLQDGQILTLGIIGGGIALSGVLGFRSLEKN